MAGRAHAERAIRGKINALNCRARHHSGRQNTLRPSEQRPEKRPQLSSPPPQHFHVYCPPPESLTETTPTKNTKARTAPSRVVLATTVAGWAHAEQENRGHVCATTCRASHHSGRQNTLRPSEQRPEKRTHLSSPPPQCLGVPTPTKRSEDRAAPHLSCPPPQWLAKPTPTEQREAKTTTSLVVPAKSVAG